ncbi:MAG: hypothetical protein A2W99_07975 [Bacteroidetes bacterium GWF2_33_16]|nr:MAG: hypothetical protein A2X00_11030 [Bacteroidetes bacterium GWE2_32_14]OFY03713.1 MAG: hypothetical protein A2W99_07975 [Bacteroidetes bacterium GWF2_33_16]
MKLTENTIIQRNPEILTSDLDGEKVMMSIQFGEYFGLGKTGSFIWDNIENPIKISDLVILITKKYTVDKDKCLTDILPFLNHLLEKELIIATK